MKTKFIIIMAVGALAPVACRRENFASDGIEVNLPGAAESAKETRGTQINSESEFLGAGLTSFTAAGWNGDKTEFVPSSTAVSYSDGLWKTTDTYLWRGSDSKTFLASANLPASGATVTNSVAPSVKQTFTYTVPTVQSWDTDTDDISPMPETDGDPFVTSWDTGIDDELILTDPYNGYEYVEIGGLKWATCNIGATSPKEYGWYFSWASTTGYVRDGSKWVTAQGGSELSGGFSWANTPFNNGSTIYNETYFNSVNSTVCPDGILALDYDAAHVNWGGSWRMPTQADFQALYEDCGGTGASIGPVALSSADPGKGIYWVSNTQTYISDYNGVAGILFCNGTSKLFFVAAGYGDNTNFAGGGTEGRYWSGTVLSNPPSYAYRLGFQNGNVSPQNANSRYQGYPVRPVLDE